MVSKYFDFLAFSINNFTKKNLRGLCLIQQKKKQVKSSYAENANGLFDMLFFKNQSFM